MAYGVIPLPKADLQAQAEVIWRYAAYHGVLSRLTKSKAISWVTATLACSRMAAHGCLNSQTVAYECAIVSPAVFTVYRRLVAAGLIHYTPRLTLTVKL